MKRQTVLKLTIKATLPIDPTNLDSVKSAAEKQATVKQVLADQGIDVQTFNGVVGTTEMAGTDPADAV